MLNDIIQGDIELLIYLNGLGSETWDGFWLFMTNKFSAIPLYLFLIFVLFKKLGVKKGGIVLLSVVLLITCSDQLSNLFKYGFKRLRPCHDAEVSSLIRLVKSHCGGKYSFFSAHASNSAALAVFFGLLFKQYFRYILQLLIVWAAVVAYSRVYLGVHYPLDIVFGMFVGTTLAYLFFKLTRFVLVKTKKSEN